MKRLATGSFRFDGFRVVVTGAASGIGLGIAQRFARAGAEVAMLDRDDGVLASAAQAIRDQGGHVQSYVADVADPARLAEIASRCQGIDALVNSAGVLLRGTVDRHDALPLWHRTIDINLSGAFHAIHAFLPQLRAQRGCIVNIASIHSFVAVRNSVAYTAAKGGLKQMTQALALELGPDGIRVNAVAPGSTDTAMTQAMRADPPALAAFLKRVPLGRTAQVDEIADATLFLASDLASYITGVTLPVDGGYCAN